jgi:predicted DNA-binding transcriptional regulator AlpA
MSLRTAKDEAVRQAREELPQPIAFNTHQTAVATGFTRKQLEHMRTRGSGPQFVKIGRHVRYLRADIEAWLASHRVANTAQEVQP